MEIFRNSVEYQTRHQQRSLENHERHERARAKFQGYLAVRQNYSKE